MNYKRIYSEIILNRVNNPLPKDVYGQKHHVLPKSLYPQYAKTKANIVKLTYREHYICHWLLTKIKPCRQMADAFWLMNSTNNDKYVNSYAYDYAKQQMIKMKLGVKLSDEIRIKMSNSHKGKVKSLEHRQNLSKSLKGKKRSKEYIEKMSTNRKGRVCINNGIVTKMIKKSDEIPEGFVLGRLKNLSVENRMKLSDAHKGKKWINNGIIQTQINDGEKLPEGFNFGWIKNKKGKWINNGDKQKYIEINSALPEGYVFGRIKKKYKQN